MSKSGEKLRDFAPIPVRAALDKKLGAAALRVFIVLASHANKQAECWPRQQLIAERLGISQQAVGQHIKKLQTLGYIEITHRKGTSNLYKLIFSPSQGDLVDHTSSSIAPPQAQEVVPPTSSDPCINKPVKQTKENNKKKLDFILPDWIDPCDWSDFEELRLAKKKPLTERARSLNLSKLEALKSQGYNAAEVIQQSIMRGWDGFFPVKNQKSSHTDNSAFQDSQKAIMDNAMGDYT